MGIPLANVANFSLGGRTRVCWLPAVAETGRTQGILSTAVSEGTKVNASLWWGRTSGSGPPKGFYQERREMTTGHTQEMACTALGSRRCGTCLSSLHLLASLPHPVCCSSSLLTLRSFSGSKVVCEWQFAITPDKLCRTFGTEPPRVSDVCVRGGGKGTHALSTHTNTF